MSEELLKKVWLDIVPVLIPLYRHLNEKIQVKYSLSLWEIGFKSSLESHTVLDIWAVGGSSWRPEFT